MFDPHAIGEVVIPTNDDHLRLTSIAYQMLDMGFPATDVDFVLSLADVPPMAEQRFFR